MSSNFSYGFTIEAMKQAAIVKTDFGKRLAALRKEQGLTQTQLGEKVGVSCRVIAYYEGETNYPPAHLIEPLAKALNVSTDELLGVKALKQQRDPQHAALWRRLKKIESLPKRDQKALLHYLDALVKKNGGSKARE
ncbi:MAG: helix-turn-helix transcriptional regulator [Nitrospirota bacterium]